MVSSSNVRRKAQLVEERLTDYYGPRPYRAEAYDPDLVGALVATLLSQHTSDLNSGRAFASLKSAFPGGWEDVRAADTADIAAAIRHGGLADMKAPRIKGLLNDILERAGGLDLSCLIGMSDAEGMRFLTGFHGVGPKTAACVLMFNLGRPVIAVDTHVHRVARRLGLVGLKESAESAQDTLLDLIGHEHAYSFHVHLIEHGRQICHAQRPECGACPVSSLCGYYHEREIAKAGPG